MNAENLKAAQHLTHTLGDVKCGGLLTEYDDLAFRKFRQFRKEREEAAREEARKKQQPRDARDMFNEMVRFNVADALANITAAKCAIRSNAEKISADLKFARQSRDITQRQLADACGFDSAAHISEIEAGNRAWTHEAATKAVDFLCGHHQTELPLHVTPLRRNNP